MLDRSGSGDSCWHKQNFDKDNLLRFAIILLAQATQSIFKLNIILFQIRLGALRPYSIIRPIFNWSLHSCVGYSRCPPLTLNFHKPPMSSLLSKQTGSKPSSTQILMQARPELPAPTTATRRTMAEN